MDKDALTASQLVSKEIDRIYELHDHVLDTYTKKYILICKIFELRGHSIQEYSYRFNYYMNAKIDCIYKLLTILLDMNLKK